MRHLSQCCTNLSNPSPEKTGLNPFKTVFTSQTLIHLFSRICSFTSELVSVLMGSGGTTGSSLVKNVHSVICEHVAPSSDLWPFAQTILLMVWTLFFPHCLCYPCCRACMVVFPGWKRTGLHRGWIALHLLPWPYSFLFVRPFPA